MTETKDAKRAETEDVYELDLEEGDDLEAAMEEAVAALDGDDDREDQSEAADEAAGDAEGALRKQLAAAEARYLRLLADFENFRKRSEREREQIGRYALMEPLRAFVEAIDNFERAMAAGGDVETLKQGLEMTLRGLGESLRRFGVEAIESVGQPFDPVLHEAVSRRDDPAVDVPTVVEEMQRGYRLHDRLVRPAMVLVAVPVEADKG